MGPNVKPPNTRKVSSVGGDSAVRRSRQAADYLAAAIIYLQDNVLLAEPLAAERLVPRLLGHRGTRPGIILVSAGLNRLIQAHDADPSEITDWTWT